MTRQIVDNLLHAGVSQSPITPPTGFTIGGPEFGDRQSLGIEDDLYARCVVIRSYDETAALVSLDVWAIANRLEEEIRGSVTDATDIPQQNVIVLATGNGTSPLLWRGSPDLPTQYRNYIRYLPDIIAGTVLEAKLALEPAAIGTVSTTLPNLSTFAKPNQSENLETERETLQLTVIQNADNHIACLLYNFACPATIIGNTEAWTSDYPGVASSALENAGISNAIFIQAASADVRPFDWWDGNANISHPERSSTDAQAFGILLATQAIRSVPNAVTRRNAQIKTATSENGDITALRIGDTTLISVNQRQPIEFAASLRSALPETHLLIGTNLAGSEIATTGSVEETVRLVNQSGIYP